MAIGAELERLLAQQVAQQNTLTVYVYCLPCKAEYSLQVSIKDWFTFSTPECKHCKQKMLVTTNEVEVKRMAQVTKATNTKEQPVQTTTSNGNKGTSPKQENKKQSPTTTSPKQETPAQPAQPAATNQTQPAKKNLPYTNTITLNGRLYANAEETELNGYPCVKFDLAHWQPKNRPTQAYKVLVFDEGLLPYAASLTKGTQVMVSGRLTTDTYNNKPQLSILANMISTQPLEVIVTEQPEE